MSEIGKINRDAAKHDPAAHYDSPLQITGDAMLTRGEKIATLERWRVQLLEQLGAADDGMPTFRSSSANLTRLEEVDEALRTLKKERGESQ